MSIDKARKYASRVRFSKDIDNSLVSLHNHKNFKLDFIQDNFYRNGLVIDKNTAPDLSSVINQTCEALFVPSSSVVSFVYSSPEIQATCLTISEDKCVLNFSSSLINSFQTSKM